MYGCPQDSQVRMCEQSSRHVSGLKMHKMMLEKYILALIMHFIQ